MKNTQILMFLFLFFLFVGFFGCKENEELNESVKISETILSNFDKTPVSRSDYNKPEDKYEFPDISGMNDWQRPNIIQERLAALQMPESLLSLFQLQVCWNHALSFRIFPTCFFMTTTSMVLML